MKKAALALTFALLAGAATPAAAQFETVEAPPKMWASGWLGGLINPGVVSDGGSNLDWAFGSSFAGGLGLHRHVGQSLALGIDASYAPARYELRPQGDGSETDVTDGRASVYTGMLSGRMRYGGGGSFFMYLTGGAGAMLYDLPDIERRDPDLALLTGAGMEYRPTSDKSLFVEWGRYWTFHQRDGVDDNMTKHGQLRLGVRTGW